MNLIKGQPVIILLLSLTLLLCNDKPQTLKPSPIEEKRIEEIGKKTVGLLLTTLQKELKMTIENNGLAAALSVCANSALNLTDSVTKSVDGIFEIKRTSFRYRNPKNAPDILERKALAYFQSTLIETGNLPVDMIEKVSEDSAFHFRYYRPLKIKPLCLNCHGKSDMITPDISYTTNKRYPQDHATGYSNEQLRGLVRISIR